MVETFPSQLLILASGVYFRTMATGFFALLDDVAALMDDVASVTKVATEKTAGLLGDDLAVNAEQASGFSASRELPVLWAIAKGSLVNKVIILPLGFVLTALAGWVIEPILVVGGVYLAYEGVEKVWHHVRKLHAHEAKAKGDERARIKGAIFVDMILSVEIIIIALSSVTGEPLLVQIVVVSLIALLATVGVYGLVALIVRMDDFGLALIRRGTSFSKRVGRGFVQALPWVIKAIGAIGTFALLWVSGGIFAHHLPAHYFGMELLLSGAVGGVALLAVSGIKRLRASRH